MAKPKVETFLLLFTGVICKVHVTPSCYTWNFTGTIQDTYNGKIQFDKEHVKVKLLVAYCITDNQVTKLEKID